MSSRDKLAMSMVADFEAGGDDDNTREDSSAGEEGSAIVGFSSSVLDGLAGPSAADGARANLETFMPVGFFCFFFDFGVRG